AGGGIEAVLLRDGDGADGAAGGVGAGLGAVEPEDIDEDAPAFDDVRAVVGDGDGVGGAGAGAEVDGGAEAGGGDLLEVEAVLGLDADPVAALGDSDIGDSAG